MHKKIIQNIDEFQECTVEEWKQLDWIAYTKAMGKQFQHKEWASAYSTLLLSEALRIKQRHELLQFAHQFMILMCWLWHLVCLDMDHYVRICSHWHITSTDVL